MARITNQIVNWTASHTLHALDISALWVDRLNRRIVGSLRRTFGD